MNENGVVVFQRNNNENGLAPIIGPFLSHKIKFTVRSNQCLCVVERLWIFKKVTIDPLRQYRLGSNNVVPHTNVVLNFILRSSILSNLSFDLNEKGFVSH